jgi:molybdenum cofactor biosynthesis protein B
VDPGLPIPDDQRVPIGTRALVLTVSDGVASGSRLDESGTVLAARLEQLGCAVEHSVVPDDREGIRVALLSALDEHVLIVTTGGTGLTPRDVTPQATAAVLDYEVPGLAEAMRAAGRAKTPMADLSRGLVGVARGRLIVNVPGSPRAALESLAALEPTLRHALETLAGPFDHGAAADRPDLPTPAPAVPDLPARVIESHDPSATARSAEPTPGNAADPWRDLPPARYDPS